jgi:hypothetical protein
MLSSATLSLILLLSGLGSRALSQLLHLIPTLIIPVGPRSLTILLRSSPHSHTTLNRSSWELVLSDYAPNVLIPELSNLL